MLKEIIPDCEKQYFEIMKREASNESGIEYKTKLTLVTTDYLTTEQGGEYGGVVLTSLDKRIVCNNTLKSRLDLCFEELLPHIRNILFPVKVAPAAVGTPDVQKEMEGGHSSTPCSRGGHGVTPKSGSSGQGSSAHHK